MGTVYGEPSTQVQKPVQYNLRLEDLRKFCKDDIYPVFETPYSSYVENVISWIKKSGKLLGGDTYELSGKLLEWDNTKKNSLFTFASNLKGLPKDKVLDFCEYMSGQIKAAAAFLKIQEWKKQNEFLLH